MLHKTKGIVLTTTKFKETSIIAQIYTREFGLQSYIVNSVRTNSKKGNKSALYQTLSVLDMIVYYQENKDIQRISEARLSFSQLHIRMDIRKSSIALFLCEILYKILKLHNEPDEHLFDFIEQSIHILEEKNDQFENFHLIFLIKFLRFLGVRSSQFDLMQISVLQSDINNKTSLTLEEVEVLKQLNSASYLDVLKINSICRRNILYFITDYYRSQFENLKNINSLTILNELFA